MKLKNQREYKNVKIGDILTIKTLKHMYLIDGHFVDNKTNKYYRYCFPKGMECIHGHKVVVEYAANDSQNICNYMGYGISASMIQEFQNDNEIKYNDD